MWGRVTPICNGQRVTVRQVEAADGLPLGDADLTIDPDPGRDQRPAHNHDDRGMCYDKADAPLGERVAHNDSSQKVQGEQGQQRLKPPAPVKDAQSHLRTVG